MIVMYYASVPAIAAARAALPGLPAWRRERAEKLKHPAAFGRSVAAGLLYAHALRRQGFDPEGAVEFLAAGKPRRRAADVHFSLSHSGRFVLCALGDAPLGADIQEPRPAKLSLARRFCPEEYAFLQRLSPAEQTEALLKLWCRKEAWVKAESGVRMLRLDEYDVLLGRDWTFTDFSLPGGVLGALCARERAAEPEWVEEQTLLNA